ncbi:MAG: hypothetical protein IT431_04195 [Phycisphaerales bacterium]|nr:hypothetical protein [Phycisphaerales bacterium]
MFRQLATPAALGGAVVLALVSMALFAGPLDPPSGPVAPTYKTLAEVEPRIAINSTNTPGDDDSAYRITKSGSYYLTANMLIGGERGIEIAASGVTIDLNGFQISGFGGLEAIAASSTALERVTIRNGFIATCNQGIYLPDTPGVIVDRVTVEDSLNGDGINVGEYSVVRDCIAVGNSDYGIYAGEGSSVVGCVASDNSEAGIVGLDGCTISACSAISNGDAGIIAQSRCIIVDCTSALNTTNGISTLSGCTITNCSAAGNGSQGINAQAGCTITNCSASENGAVGIAALNGSVIVGCSATENDRDGIDVSFSCTVRGNTCAYNGWLSGSGAGIRVQNDGNRIEGNTCIGADRGIDVDGADNIIVRNTCSGNTTNWTIVAGNAYGPIVVTPSGGAVSGNSAAAALGSTDPNANFTY